MAKRNFLDRFGSDKQLMRVLKFIVKFNLFAIPLYLVLITGWNWPALQKWIADFTFSNLVAMGYNPSISDLLISIPIKNGDWAAFINWDCTGWKSMLALFALIMATDFRLKRKAFGMILIPVVFFINLLRILFMFFWVKTFDLAHYQIVHSLIWSWGLILTILLLWFVWMKYDFLKIFDRNR
ncbi:MAG TPA: exosortase/archaeosortase family protein [archaeon]|nr:exosortase/archaeosortase family protein [archaeon]